MYVLVSILRSTPKHTSLRYRRLDYCYDIRHVYLKYVLSGVWFDVDLRMYIEKSRGLRVRLEYITFFSYSTLFSGPGVDAKVFGLGCGYSLNFKLDLSMCVVFHPIIKIKINKQGPRLKNVVYVHINVLIITCLIVNIVGRSI